MELLKKECDDLQDQTDCTSLNNLLDNLTKKLSAKEYELQNLKQEKNMTVNQSYNISSHYGMMDESRCGVQTSQMDSSVVLQNNDIEKICKELESVKMVLENETEAGNEEEEEENAVRGRGSTQNKSFSYFGQAEQRRSFDIKTTARDAPDIEKQIKLEVQQLMAMRTKIRNDQVQFNREFEQAELNPEM